MHAHGVPMAVPLSCFHHVLPNWKMLFLMVRSNRAIVSSIGILWSASCPKVVKYFRSVSVPSSVDMFVYMETASVVAIVVDGCSVPILSSRLRRC